MPVDRRSKVELAAEKSDPMREYCFSLAFDLFYSLRKKLFEEIGCAGELGETGSQMGTLALADAPGHVGDGPTNNCTLEILVGQVALVRLIRDAAVRAGGAAF